VGQTVVVVRRYRERGERLWVIEMADGSRQYVPASWCTPLAPPENLPEWDPSSAEEDRSGLSRSPLSLVGLRDLADLVRRLREREGVCAEEHADEAISERWILPPDRTDVPATGDGRRRGRGVTRLGELSSLGPAPPDRVDYPDCPPPNPARTDRGGGSRREVRAR
jgi:hypothetical protein